MTESATAREHGLSSLGSAVDWTDVASASIARMRTPAGHGRLRELTEWLSGTSGGFPPTPPERIRCVVLGPVSAPVAALAESIDVGIREAVATAGVAAGAAIADEEVDSGADLLVVATPLHTTAAAVVVGLVTGAEPVALLPRGPAAVDGERWIEQAVFLRDTRRRVAGLERDPDAVLAVLDDPGFAAVAGLVLQGAARRTPVVLDGTPAVAAALLGHRAQPRAARWWRIADVSPDPVHARAVAELVEPPVLDLGSTAGDGVAGLLAVPVLRAAAGLAAPR